MLAAVPKEFRMRPILRLVLPGLLLLAACGPRPTESPPIPRGTALPPPGVTMAAPR